MNILKLIPILLICAVCININSQDTKRKDNPLGFDLANSYFRIGQQAALIAISNREMEIRRINYKYGFKEWENNTYTNKEDWAIIRAGPINCIDDPRIFDVVRSLNNGKVLGLDTNNWSIWPNVHIWTILKE